MALANDKTCTKCGLELKWIGSFRDGHMDCDNLMCLHYHSHGRAVSSASAVIEIDPQEDLSKALKEFYGIKDDGLGDAEDGS